MNIFNASHLNAIFLSLALIFVSAGGGVIAQEKEKAMLSEGISFTEGKWQDILAKAKSSNKYIFVDAYAVWCGPCKSLKSKTFKEQQAALYFNDNFINYAVDTEKGEGTMLAEKWDITSYPTLLFFSPEGKLLFKQVGFVDGNELVELGKQAESKK